MVEKKTSKSLMSKEKILALLLIVIAGGLVLLPKHQEYEGIKPEELLSKVINSERYITADELADKIIKKDDSYLLIDLRDEESYAKHTLPNAVNIPIEKLLDDESEKFINQDTYNVVLFSNDSFYADKAWILCSRLGYTNIRVLKGGINNWFNTVINPPKPLENSPKQDLELYNSRKEASKFFGVVYPEQIKNKPVAVKKVIPKKVTPKKVVPVKKKKKMPMEGGC
jgi:rhodanese-related sulfurtransferase